MRTISRICIALLWVTFGLWSVTAFGDVPIDERAVATGGFGKWLLSVLFESGSIADQPENAGIIGSVIRPFSLVCLVVITLVICTKAVQHLLIVAQAKDVESSPVSMTWAPIHLAVAAILAFPLGSGYSVGQYSAIWVAEQSNLLGNLTSEAAMGNGEYAVVTETPMPAVRTTVQGIVDSEVCKVVLNELGEYVASQGGSQIQVESRQLSNAEINQIAGAPNDTFDDGQGYSRKGIVYEVIRGGNLGNFINQPGGINALCGLTIVEHDSFYGDMGAVEFNEEAVGDRQDATAPNGSGGVCPGAIMCPGGGSDPVSRKNEKTAIANAFQTAHSNISDQILALKDSSEIQAAVEELTYDVELYFDALVEPDAQTDYLNSQAQEPVRVARAGSKVVDSIDGLQTAIYKQYADALDSLRSTNSVTGDSHKDAVLRTGWPVLGLYWFQQQSYNSQVMKTTNLSAESRMSVGQLIQIMRATTNDEKFVERLANRLSEYRRSVNRQILNTRLDSNPLSKTATGGVSNSATPRNDSQQAASIKETTATYIDTMLDSAGDSQGALTTDGTGAGPSNFFRGVIYPWLVSGLREDNLVTGLVNTGHNLIVLSEVMYGVELAVRVVREKAKIEAMEDESIVSTAVGYVLNPAGSFVSDLATGFANSYMGILIGEFLSDLKPLMIYLFFLGLFLAFYLPAVVMVQWIIGLVQWMIYVIEATVVIPLWAILFASDMGQKAFAPQTAQQGLTHLVSILFYPALMVIGFTIGIKVLDVLGTFIIDYIMIGFLGMTANYSFGIVSTLVGVTLVGVVAYQVIMRIFSGMLELNDRAISWIGNRATFGENSGEQAARSAFVALAGRGESAASQAGNKRKNDQNEELGARNRRMGL